MTMPIVSMNWKITVSRTRVPSYEGIWVTL
jgi:hypothetical protein